MAFAFGKLAFLLLRPSNLLTILALIGLAGGWRRHRAWARGLLALSLGVTVAATLLPIGKWLIGPLEDRFPAPAVYPARIDGVVVLGGGIDPDVTAGRGAPTFTDPAERYMALLELARPAPGEAWLLVTSAGHMPRSVGVFRAVGWPVLPWPVDYRTAGRTGVDLRFRVADRLYDLDEAAYEWLGLAYYRAVGWTTELFPGPSAPAAPQG